MSKVHYEKGEREQSASSPGVAKRSTEGGKTVLILSNYEVGIHKTKPEHEKALAEVVLEYHLGRACVKMSVSRVTGYTDAVDTEATNTRLRELRANWASGYLTGLVQQVNRQYKGTETVAAAPAGQYLNAKNDSAAARADNRAVKIELTPIPLDHFFQVRAHPDVFKKTKDTCGVVSVKPWQKKVYWIRDVLVRGRATWATNILPLWEKEVVYYNTNLQPGPMFLNKIVVHHTSNNNSLDKNEIKQQGEGYAAIGYHFAIDQAGRVYQGRPLEVMGSHAGVGENPGPMNDPDWGAVGIVLLGDFHSDFKSNQWMPDDPSDKMLKSLKELIQTLKNEYAIGRLLMHKEVTRAGKPTVCPGENIYKHVEAMRSDLKMSGP